MLAENEAFFFSPPPRQPCLLAGNNIFHHEEAVVVVVGSAGFDTGDLPSQTCRSVKTLHYGSRPLLYVNSTILSLAKRGDLDLSRTESRFGLS